MKGSFKVKLTKQQQKFMQNPRASLNQAPVYDRVKQQFLKDIAAQRPAKPPVFQMPATTPTATGQQITYGMMQQAYQRAMTSGPPQPVVVVKARNAGYTQHAQVMQQLINDAFFKASPFMAYLKKNHIVDDDFENDYIHPHVVGQLCEHNPFCEECYS